MRGKRDPARGGAGGVWAAAIVALLLVIYLLSPPFVGWGLRKARIYRPNSATIMFYTPAAYLQVSWAPYARYLEFMNKELMEDPLEYRL